MKKYQHFYMLFSLLLLSAALLCSCGGDPAETTLPSDTDGKTHEETVEPIETSTNTDTDTISETLPVTIPVTDTDTTDTDMPDEPEFFNPLTGLPSELDLSSKRPVAIMINNIKKATPQHGIADADIIYECLAEGGITRLLMLSTEYEKLDVTGSVRSSRHYYIDFAQDYDAIYIHAGASPMAYTALAERNIDNIDGVKYAADTFYRDAWRRENMGYEHSLMTTGERLLDGIEYKKYRTEIKDGYQSPLNFIEYGNRVSPNGGSAADIMLTYSKSQVVNLTYDAESGKYLRFQFNGTPHIDNNTGEQLAFDNVIVILTDLWAIKGDEAGRLEVITTGSGKGYYATDGMYIPILWNKPDGDTPVSYTYENGDPLIINRGKTFISIFDKDYSYSIK